MPFREDVKRSKGASGDEAGRVVACGMAPSVAGSAFRPDASYMRPVMTVPPILARAAPILLAFVLAGCSGDEGDIAAEREAARSVARENRGLDDTGATIRVTARPGHYDGVAVASVEEVAEAIEAIPTTARSIRTAKRVAGLTVLRAPEPIVIGPSARGDLQMDNTAPLETIRNAIEGSALAHTRVRAEGVFMADIVAARFEDEALTVYIASP